MPRTHPPTDPCFARTSLPPVEPLPLDEPACRQIVAYTIAHLPITVCVVDRDLRYLFSEGEGVRFPGHATVDLIGSFVGEVTGSEHLMQPLCRRAIEEGRDLSIEYSALGKAYRLSVAPFFRDGEIVGGIIVSQRTDTMPPEPMVKEIAMSRKVRIRSLLRDIETQLDETGYDSRAAIVPAAAESSPLLAIPPPPKVPTT